MEPVPPTFCVLPWIHRFTNIGGEIQLCCTSDGLDNSLRRPDGTRMSAPADHDSNAIMNSAFMKEVRVQMRDGAWPKACGRCKLVEDSGGVSRRKGENQARAAEIPGLLARTGNDGSIPVEVKFADFRLGNRCNLACRMCNPRFSARWDREWRHVEQDLFSPDSLPEDGEGWFKDPGVFAQFEKDLPTLDKLHFGGGEPLLEPEMLRYLRACVDSGHSSHIRLSYNTNLTRIPPEARELWPRFQAVVLLVSVDAFGELNEYIRYPSRWSVIDANLRELDRNFDRYGLKEVTLSATAQAYNVLHLARLYDYASTFERVSPIPQIQSLVYPHYYRTQVLPPQLKELATGRLSRLLERLDAGAHARMSAARKKEFLDQLRGVIGFMNRQDLRRFLPEFRKAAESKDAHRGQRLADFVPEMGAM